MSDTVAVPDICQDSEYDGEVGMPIPVFWAKGHGFDEREFVRAVLEYCLDNDVDIPAIRVYDDLPREVWQRNVEHFNAVEYDRADAPSPDSPRDSWFPVTLLDLELPRRHGNPKCAVSRCSEPWFSGLPIRVCIEPTADGLTGQMTVSTYLCREHSRQFPGPSYRVFMVPVGATILLPEPEAAAVPASPADDGSGT